MSPLISASSLTLSKQFPPGPRVQDALNVLHNPQQTLQLSTYVLSVVPNATKGENNFLVTKQIPLFGGIINGSSTYNVKWVNVPEGADIEVDAGLGTFINNEMRVKEDNGVVVFTENVSIKSPFLLMWFIKSQLRTTHVEFHEKLKESVINSNTL